ncbi:MAG: lysophospholipid acyltransferase family protein [Terracidiphilus sp.]|jgi:1-acyl-sn-glycerol-3-phosphate acyltransferase
MRVRRPKPVPRFYRWRTNLVQTPALSIVTGFWGSLALLVSLFEKSGRIQHRIAQKWARMCVWITGSRVTVRGIQNLSKHPVAVYASNHTSYMDTPVVFSSLPFQFRILAKRELWKIAFIGWYLDRSGQIPIDVGNAHAALASLGAGVKALRGGMPLFVFPEGARTPDGHLQAFLSGAAFLAIRAQVPLIPVALSGVYDLLPIHTHHIYPSEMTLSVGEPIETRGMTVRHIDELTASLKSAIEALLESGAHVETESLAV